MIFFSYGIVCSWFGIDSFLMICILLFIFYSKFCNVYFVVVYRLSGMRLKGLLMILFIGIFLLFCIVCIFLNIYLMYYRK